MNRGIEIFFGTLNATLNVIGSDFKRIDPIVDVAEAAPLLLLGGAQLGGLPPLTTNLDPLAHRAILVGACL